MRDVGRERQLVGCAPQQRLAALGGLYFVWVPSHATQLAALVGIGRGVDLIIYTWVGISLLLLLNLHLKLRSQMELITVLARELAIANARAGQFEEQVALAPELNETVPRHDGRSLARNKPGDAGGKRADQDEIVAGVLIGDGSVQP